MSSLEVLVYDDHEDLASEVAQKISSACTEAQVSFRSGIDLTTLVDELHHRRAQWRVEPDSNDNALEVDRARVVVVDYDLINFAEQGDTTGSRLAYLLRCFSACGTIVILNQFGENVFDLSLTSTNMHAAWDDFADLHIGSQQIGNSGLWSARSDGYRPWYWPVIPEMTLDFEKCVRDVEQNGDARILAFFGLDSRIDWLSPQSQSLLSGNTGLEHATFDTFANSPYGGISRKDRLPTSQLARVVAARMRTILNSIIVPNQNLLVDAPHLVSRFPSLLRERTTDLVQWNLLCEPTGKGVEELLVDMIGRHRFEPIHWLWRPAWYWPDINKDEQIEEVQNPWSIEAAELSFCEDISRFVPSGAAREFSALVEPPFVRRFILRRQEAIVRQQLGAIAKGSTSDPSQVTYVPEAVLAQ